MRGKGFAFLGACLTLLGCTGDGGTDSPWGGGLAHGAFSVVILPDTQYYSQDHPDIFASQTAWLLEQRENLNLRFVLHLGDVVNLSFDREQWQRAQQAMDPLRGELPFALASGNHDYGVTVETENAGDRETLLHEYFPRAVFEGMPTFGGFFGEPPRVDNAYHTFEMGGESWLVLALEFGPRDAVLEWADSVLREHSGHHTLVITHAYLFHDGTLYGFRDRREEQHWSPYSYGLSQLPEGVNDGQQIWDKLLRHHPQVVAVLCGHVHSPGVARAESKGDAGTTVTSMLSNYQHEPEGGGGYLRVMTLDPARREVRVVTFSPWLDTFREDAAHQFTFVY